MSDAYAAALSGIKASKAEMALNSHNIANANVEGYTRLVLSKNSSIVGNKVGGVDIEGITTFIDTNLHDRVYSRISAHEFNEIISANLDRIHSEFGVPNSGASLDAVTNKMFTSLEQLVAAPNSASLKLSTLQDADNLVSKVSGLANKVEKLRYDIDGQIKTAIDELNVELENAYNLNIAINTYVEGSLERVNAEDKLRKVFEKVSTYLNITKFNDSNGKIKVFTADGTSIVGDSQYFLKYTPTTSDIPLITDDVLNPIVVSYYNNQGHDAKFDREIVSGGKSSEITHKLGNGKLSGLLALRDKELPKMLAQLDRYAKNLSDEFNRIHNEGVAFNPPTELKGHTLVSRDQYLGFSGNVRVGIVDANGRAISTIPSVNLDLANLNSGNGVGKANIESFMQELDYHFGAKLSSHKKATVGNLQDIKLTAVSSEMTAGSPLELDLELYNFSQTAGTVRILGVTATDSLTNNILGSFNNATHNIAAGKFERTGMTGPSIILNNTTPINYPYTVNVDVRVNDGTTDFDATISYTISNPVDNPINGIRNQRFSATAVTGAATLVAPTLASGVLKTYLIDQDGYDVAANSTDGLGILKIASLSGDYKIVIDNLDSEHIGVSGSTILPTNEKFSYFLGLNDFFERSDKAENWGGVKNAAYYLKIRDDIKANPNMISTGSYKQNVDYSNPANILYSYELTEGDISNLNKLVDLTKKKIFFNQAGGLTGTTITLNEYAAEILAYNTTQLRRYESFANESKTIRKALQDKIQNIKGVDINEELANMITFQQSFTASAKLINAVREMDKILMELI